MNVLDNTLIEYAIVTFHVMLGVARNKSRNSETRYKGVAKLTSRQGRKRFMIK